MMIDEEEGKAVAEVSTEAIYAVFADMDTLEEEEIVVFGEDDDVDAVDLAFTEDEGHW